VAVKLKLRQQPVPIPGMPGICGWCRAILFLSLLSAAPLRAAGWSAESRPQYDQLFQRTNGWTGADGDFAVSLTNGLTLWLFSDTFVGEVRDGQRTNATMVNNSAAWQHGVDPAQSHAEFFYGQSQDGKPAALITPDDGQGWFWLFDAVMARGKLFLFLGQIMRTDNQSVFGFRQTGVWLGEVANPLDPPTHWQVRQRRIPFAHFRREETLSFGSAVLATNGFVYVYGTREREGAGKSMILARAPETALANFSSWEFRAEHGWTTNTAGLANLCRGLASEYSVSWFPARQDYVLICTKNGLSDQIVARTAPEPWGPWSAATVVWRCPEMAWDRQNFCYAAKAHPLLAAGPDELIVTYAANSYELAHVVNDARLYWPRFVRVRWK
jgi:hypothetical protein